MYYCYIIYSENLDRYYIGSTTLQPEERLEHHLSKYYGDAKFTAKAEDWILLLSISCDSLHQVRKIESHIKKMKSKKYIHNLKKYPEMVTKLLEKYRDS